MINVIDAAATSFKLDSFKKQVGGAASVNDATPTFTCMQ